MSDDSNSRDERYLIPNVGRSLRILEYLAREVPEASIPEITKHFDIPKNSVFRIIKSLELSGFVEEKERKYYVTPRLLYLGYSGMNKKGFIANSLDSMNTLRDEINETVMIGTLLGNHIVILEQLPAYELIKFTTDIGHRVPVQASAPGKAIIAALPEHERNNLLNHLTFTRFTDYTLPSKTAMLDEITKVQEVGYSIDKGEEVSGICCVAACVLDYRNTPIGSIWVTGPEKRMRDKGMERIGQAVSNAAGSISLKFGFDKPDHN